MKKFSLLFVLSLILVVLAACSQEEPTQTYDFKATNSDWDTSYSVVQEPSVGQKQYELSIKYVGTGDLPKQVGYELADEKIAGTGELLVNNSIKKTDSCNECTLATQEDKTLTLTYDGKQETLVLKKQ